MFGSSIVLLELTTDRHEATRGLSATAELIVLYVTGSASGSDRRPRKQPTK